MKKIVAFIGSLILTVGLFAQGKPSTGLTDSDVKNFIKNYPTFVKESEKIGIDESDLAILATYGDIEKLLEKIGISGPNRAEKLSMIGYCVAVCTIDQNMDAETLAMMKALGLEDPAASMRALINEKDYEIVKKNYAALKKVLELD
ncbi:MAG: hypothetical protein MJ188_09265 [Treponema sp.]|nr:hypothetical protein [Treponema sp.]